MGAGGIARTNPRGGEARGGGAGAVDRLGLNGKILFILAERTAILSHSLPIPMIRVPPIIIIADS
jgi:hypothetical protein